MHRLLLFSLVHEYKISPDLNANEQKRWQKKHNDRFAILSGHWYFVAPLARTIKIYTERT